MRTAGYRVFGSFQLGRNGTVSLLDRTLTGQAATCWTTTAGPFPFASNVGTPVSVRWCCSATSRE